MRKKQDQPYFLLILILVIATTVRIMGFSFPHSLTFDEGVHIHLGSQLTKSLHSYHTKEIDETFLKGGRKLPDYFKKPLFKHPPLYSYFISVGYRATHPSSLIQQCKVAVCVSILSGILLILLTFFLGRLIYNSKVAFVASLLMVIDPIHWLCSQRIWMETTLVLFMWLALFYILKAIKITPSDAKIRKSQMNFYLAGIFTGLALLTKSTAFFIYPITFSFILLANRNLFKNIHLWVGLLISLIFLLPWALWNLTVYGKRFLIESLVVHNFIESLDLRDLLLLIGGGFFLLLYLLFLHQRVTKIFSGIRFTRIIFPLLLIGGLSFIFLRPYLLKGLGNMLNLRYLPPVGGDPGFFINEPSFFYLRRVLELSPFYLFSFSGFLFLLKPTPEDLLLIMAAFLILLVSSLWGNYQCRYILSVVPPLLILAAKSINWIWEKVKNIVNHKLRLTASISFLMMIVFVLIKTLMIDLFFAFFIQPCYF